MAEIKKQIGLRELRDMSVVRRTGGAAPQQPPAPRVTAEAPPSRPTAEPQGDNMGEISRSVDRLIELQEDTIRTIEAGNRASGGAQVVAQSINRMTELQAEIMKAIAAGIRVDGGAHMLAESINRLAELQSDIVRAVEGGNRTGDAVQAVAKSIDRLSNLQADIVKVIAAGDGGSKTIAQSINMLAELQADIVKAIEAGSRAGKVVKAAADSTPAVLARIAELVDVIREGIRSVAGREPPVVNISPQSDRVWTDLVLTPERDGNGRITKIKISRSA